MDKINKKKFIYYFPVFLVFSYLIGFVLGEDSTGGAYKDFFSHSDYFVKLLIVVLIL